MENYNYGKKLKLVNELNITLKDNNGRIMCMTVKFSTDQAIHSGVRFIWKTTHFPAKCVQLKHAAEAINSSTK